MRSATLLSAITCLSLAAAVGCNEQEPVPEQLEELTVSVTSGGSGGSGSEILTASGGASVTGEGRDFHVDVGAGALAFEVHLPGMSDLSSIDGRDVSVELTNGWTGYGYGVTVVMVDAAGPLFVASSVPGASANIDWGAVVAEKETNGVVWAYTSVAVHHDADTTFAMPGDVVDATIEGGRWRVVPIAAYRVEDASGQTTDCMVPPDVLGFEMLRVEQPVVLERVERPEGLPMLEARSCG